MSNSSVLFSAISPTDDQLVGSNYALWTLGSMSFGSGGTAPTAIVLWDGGAGGGTFSLTTPDLVTSDNYVLVTTTNILDAADDMATPETIPSIWTTYSVAANGYGITWDDANQWWFGYSGDGNQSYKLYLDGSWKLVQGIFVEGGWHYYNTQKTGGASPRGDYTGDTGLSVSMTNP